MKVSLTGGAILCMAVVALLVAPTQTMAAAKAKAKHAFVRVLRASKAMAILPGAKPLAKALGLREDRPLPRARSTKRRYRRPYVKFGEGRSFKASVLDPATLALFGVAGLRPGDRVRLVGLPKGRIGIVALRPRRAPVILKYGDGVLTSCGCFEHGTMMHQLLHSRAHEGGPIRPR